MTSLFDKYFSLPAALARALLKAKGSFPSERQNPEMLQNEKAGHF
jgi:hypothetical protein